jgi:signal peptidase
MVPMARDIRSRKDIRKREEMRKSRRRKEEVLSLIKDVVIAAVIVSIVMASLWVYTGFIWPPMVVVESGSMMHGKDSAIGIIDTGDLTLVKKVESRHDIITYIEANPIYNSTSRAHKGYKQYGDFGDVIIYEKNGMSGTPVIHRAIMWVVFNTSDANMGRPCADIPDLDMLCVHQFSLPYATYRHEDILIDFSVIFNRDYARHDGFLTHGDHNQPVVDQASLPDKNGNTVSSIPVEWVVGKAEGELPWFGIMKLMASGSLKSDDVPPSSWKGLVVSIVLIITIPLAIDIGLYLHAKAKKKGGGGRRAKRDKAGKRKDEDEGDGGLKKRDRVEDEMEDGEEGEEVRKGNDEVEEGEEKEDEEDAEGKEEESMSDEGDGGRSDIHKKKRGSKAKALEDEKGMAFDVEDELDKDY